jgi:DNA-binding transcriptional LysR family regulator
MSEWRGIEELLAVVRYGSFTAAGNKLGVSKSYISKTVQELEDRIGVRLLIRTTRRLSLTDAGHTFHKECTELQERLRNLESELGRYSTEPLGRLRIGLSGTFGSDYMSDLLARFNCENPRIKIEPIAYHDEGEVAQESFDLVIRYGALPDSNRKARMFGYLSYCLCASREYIDKHGWPSCPEELNSHACLTDLSSTMTFNDDVVTKVSPHWRSNSGISLRSAVRNGLGIASLPVSIIAQQLKDGSVLALEEEWAFYDRECWAVYSPGIMSAATRAFIDFLVDSLPRVKVRPSMVESML